VIFFYYITNPPFSTYFTLGRIGFFSNWSYTKNG